MSDIKKLLSKSEEAGKPTEGERELLIESLLHQSTLHNRRGDTALALLFTSAAQELESLQAENENLKKQNSELFILKERFKARNHKALDYLYSEDCNSAYNARCALEGGHHE